jgi:phosphatidylglycerol---prolipoprotein diacylglyceryl transferase
VRPLIPWTEPLIWHLFDVPGWRPVELHGFGVLVGIAFLVGTIIAKRKARRDGLDAELIHRSVTWLVVGVFVGGHLGHVLMYDLDRYIAAPWELLYVWEGLSSFGGFVSCAALMVWFFRKQGQRIWGYLDSLTYAVTFAWFWGRMGCAVSHDHPGQLTEFWLGVQGLCDQGVTTRACHDLGLYEMLLMIPLGLWFWWLERKPRPVGFYLGLLPLVYGPVRFGMDFLRLGDVRYFGLTPAQYGSVVCVVGGAAILWHRRDAERSPGRLAAAER